LRITGGAWRSRRLSGPSKRMPLRPTPDSMRERAFQVLGLKVVDADFLDLFSGTGAVGLEALSRGASAAIFVEQHPAAVRLIRKNLSLFPEVGVGVTVLGLSAHAAITRLVRLGTTFDIVWADPPFPTWHDGFEVLVAAFERGVIRQDGIACLECPERAEITNLPRDVVIRRDLDGGASRVVMMARLS